MLTYQSAAELFAKARNPASGKPIDRNTRIFKRDLAELKYTQEKLKAGADPATIRPMWAEEQSGAGFTQPEMSAQGPQQSNFKMLPAAAQFAGKRMRADDGTIYRSDGKKWAKE